MNRSRLPISTSVRRPASIAKGSTSFIGLTRPTAIPSTSRKYAQEIFTPQTKTPRAPFGASTAGKSYRSSLATEKKYKKPLPEREELQQMFDNLVDFIKIHAPNLPSPEARKFFSSVSTTESTRIFELLISCIIPDFKITRLETDVPEALANLDYPYVRSVTKSSLVSVTSRTAATSLLVIFDWLIELIHAKEDSNAYSTAQTNTDAELDEWTEVCKLPFRPYVVAQEKAHVEAIQKLRETLLPIQDMQSLRNTHEELTEERDRLANELEDNDILQEKQTLEEDIVKCDEYKSKMIIYFDSKEKELEEKHTQASRARLQSEDLLKRKDQVEFTIKSHELTEDKVVADQMIAQKLELERPNLRKQIDGTMAELDVLRTKEREERNQIMASIERKLKELREMHEKYDTCYKDYSKSSFLAERKKQLDGWLTRLKQLSPDDIGQVDKVFHDINLYMERMETTELCLKSEICDQQSKDGEEANKLRESNERHKRELLPLLEETSRREEQEIKDNELKFMGSKAKVEGEKEEKRRQLDSRLDNHIQEASQLRHKSDVEVQRRDTEVRQSVEMMELNEQHLRVVFESHQKEEMAMMRELEKEAKRWREARSIAEANNQIVRDAQRRLKKKFNLSQK